MELSDDKMNFDKELLHISNWKYANSSIIGISHIETKTPKQDFCKIEEIDINNSKYLYCAVADGAGSAKYSDKSSKYISELFAKKIKTFLKENTLENLTRDIISSWFIYFQKVLKKACVIYKIESIRKFATTFLFAILSEKENVFVQIGDGVIALGDESEFECVFMPQNGEYLNTTFFATDKNIIEQFMFKKSAKKVKRLLMFSDGIEIISFDFLAKKPHFRFFNPFFLQLEECLTAGNNEEMSEFISGFLNCERVNQKTDDDKTMLIVSSIDNTKESVSK